MDNFNDLNNILPNSAEAEANIVEPVATPEEVSEAVTDTVSEEAADDMVKPQSGLSLASDDEAAAPHTGFKLATDNGAPQPNSGMAQPGMNGGMAPQGGFGQPGMNPGMAPQGGFGQPGINPGMAPQGGFGQPGMNPGMAPQGGFGQPGMGGMPPQGGNGPKPKKQKKPLSKGAIGGIIGGGIALIALIVCGIIFLPKLFRTDKEVVIDAFEGTFGLESETVSSDDAFGSAAMQEAYAENGGTTDVKATINSIYGDTSYGGYYFQITDVTDLQNMLVNYTFDFGSANGSLLKAVLIADEENTYLQLPDMISGYFTLPNENMFVELQNSELGQAMELSGMTEMNMNDLYFAAASTDDASSDVTINNEYVNAIESVWDNMTYEKQGKAKIRVNGKNVTAKEYYVTLSEEDIENALVAILEGAEAEALADPEMLAENGFDEATFTSTMTQLKNMIPQIITGDLLIKVYIDDDKIVKITCADDISLYGVSMSYDFYLDIDDDYTEGLLEFTVMEETLGVKFNATETDDTVDGGLTIYGTGETIDANFKVTDTTSDGAGDVDVYFDLMENGSKLVSADMSVTVNKDNSFSGDCVIDIPDTTSMDITLSGSFKDINKGVSYTMDMSEIKVSVDGEEMLDMSMTLVYDVSKHTAANIDSSLPQYDIITMTEDALYTVIEDNVDTLNAWAEDFIINGGPLTSGYEDLIEDATTTTGEPEVETPDETSADSKILKGDDHVVEILGTVPGFEFYAGDDYYVYFETPEWSYIQYSLYEGYTVEEILGAIYVPESDIVAQETNQQLTVDGETVYYSWIQDKEFGYLYSAYVFVKEIDSSTYLVVDAGIYDEDDTYTKEDLVQALSSQYYTIIK